MATTLGFSTQTVNDDYYSTPEYYYQDIEDEACDKTKVIKDGAIFNTVFFSVVVVLSLLGNILVLVILAKYENLKSLTNAFIVNLAVSDLLFTAGLPFWALYHMNSDWILPESACKAVSFIFYVGFYSNGFFLIVMTLHRYLAVVNPLSDIVSSKGFTSFLASVILWSVSMIAAMPSLLFSKLHVQGSIRHCVYDPYWRLWGIYQQNVFFLVTFSVFIFCYSQIIWQLLGPTSQKRRLRTVKLIFSLLVVFIVGWVPYNVLIFLRALKPTDTHLDATAKCKASKMLDYAYYVCRLFAYSHCCLNPVFYVFLGIKFKSHLKKLLRALGPNSNNSFRNRNSRLTITSLTSGEELVL